MQERKNTSRKEKREDKIANRRTKYNRNIIEKIKRKNKGIPSLRLGEFAEMITHENDEPRTIEEALTGIIVTGRELLTKNMSH